MNVTAEEIDALLLEGFVTGPDIDTDTGREAVVADILENLEEHPQGFYSAQVGDWARVTFTEREARITCLACEDAQAYYSPACVDHADGSQHYVDTTYAIPRNR